MVVSLHQPQNTKTEKRMLFKKQFMIIWALSLFFTIHGCAYSKYTTPLETVIKRAAHEIKYKSNIDFDEIIGERSSSIGDRMFLITRYTETSREVIIPTAPKGLQPLPNTESTWLGTYSYNGPDGQNLVVYTSPSYYNGQIGVILDDKDLMATINPFVCVRGTKTGRRYLTPPAYTGSPFFGQEKKITEVWGLRYGGRRGKSFQFEVIDRENPKEIEIVQDILVSENEFFNGFVVKGVLVKGLSVGEYGTINFILEDTITDN